MGYNTSYVLKYANSCNMLKVDKANTKNILHHITQPPPQVSKKRNYINEIFTSRHTLGWLDCMQIIQSKKNIWRIICLVNW